MRSAAAPNFFNRPGRTICLTVWLLALLFIGLPAAAAPLRIGVVMDGPWAGNDPLLELFKAEIFALTSGEFPVSFPADKTVTGDWTMDGVKGAADKLLRDPEVDLLLAIGVLTSHDLAHRGPLPKPTVAPFTVDRAIQGYPLAQTASGVRNFCYLAPPSPIRRDMQAFSELLPFRRLAVLTNRPYLDFIPALTDELAANLASKGIAMTSVAVDSSAEAVLSALPKDIDAVYVTPLLRLPQAEFQILIEGLKSRKLPSFSYFGHSEVQQGILAGAAPKSDFPRLARRTALTIQSILLGKDPGELPVFFSQEARLSINMRTARAIGFSPTWEQLIEAELIAEETNGPTRELTLAETVKEALNINLDLAASDRRIAAGEAEVRKARAALLPQLSAVANGLLLDEDRAEASFGSQTERSMTGSLVLEQSLYSESRRTNYHVQGQQQEARLQERRQLRLDIVQAAAAGYLTVLRAKTLQTIQTNNLLETRSNLTLARRRQAVGFSGPAEVYRWESQLARDRKTVVQAATQRSLAELALNRLLQRPAEEAFTTAEVDLGAPEFLVSNQRLEPYLATPAAFARYRDFMVQEGLAEIPELQRIDRAIDAQERIRLAARRSFWTPEVSLRAGISQHFYEGGAGVDSPFSDTLLPIEIPQANDTDWSVGLNLALPLFTSGARSAELEQANEELARLHIEHQALSDRFEQRIRSALQRARASHTIISLSAQGATAARKNLGLVTDAYSRGLVSIIELIDAQNAALVADSVAASSVYDFFIDLMEVQRAVGRFDFFLGPQQREDWFGRLEEFWRQDTIASP
jgi:outer membrane protein TolC